MTCKHFGSCGSCGLYELSYPEQLQQKEEKVSSLLAPFYAEKLEVFDSPDSHYRASVLNSVSGMRVQDVIMQWEKCL